VRAGGYSSDGDGGGIKVEGGRRVPSLRQDQRKQENQGGMAAMTGGCPHPGKSCPGVLNTFAPYSL
jgi:hypothetical protein